MDAPLRSCPAGPIFPPVGGNPDYGDKRTCNNRLGPGGGTRRLHQFSRSLRACGAETGSTDDQRGQLSLGELPPLSVHDHSCQRQPCSGGAGRVSGSQYQNEALALSRARRGSQVPGNRNLHLPPALAAPALRLCSIPVGLRCPRDGGPFHRRANPLCWRQEREGASGWRAASTTATSCIRPCAA